MNESQYILIEDDPPPLYNVFDKAYKTKIATEFRRSKSHKFVSQHKYMLHQIYPRGTWFVDLVKFGDYWYVFFVEANTRYLIVIQGNSDFLNTDSVLVNTNKRVPTDIFLEVFQRFEEMNEKKVLLLIGDSEKAFWSKSMREYYNKRNIGIKIINVNEDGHIGMAILDRLVRTIRDICYNMKFTQSVTPKEIIEAVVVYNNTIHHTFKNIVGEDWTPLMVHENEEYEDKFIDGLFNDNIRISSQGAFLIRNGTKVVVFNEMETKKRKIRSKILDGEFVVEKHNNDGTYTIKNKEDNSIISNVPRRNLRPIY